MNVHNVLSPSLSAEAVIQARRDTPGVEKVIHLNNCGASLMPRPVLDTMVEHLQREALLGGYEAEEAAQPELSDTYRAVAELLNARPEEIALVENATRAWDLVFYSFPLAPGDEIITCRSEYASNYIAFLQARKQRGIRIVVAPDDEHGQVDVEGLRHCISPRTRLIAINHVPTHCGLVNPAAEIGRVAREHGIPFLLDACQSVGQLPIDVQSMGVDFLSATGRKFLRGPRGVGFLYVRHEWLSRLEPHVLDLRAATWTSEDGYEVRSDARRFETWESCVAARLGLRSAVRYAMGWGLEAIWERIRHLASFLRQELQSVPGLKIHDIGKVRGAIVSFTVDGWQPHAIVQKLRERRINVNVVKKHSALLDMQERGLEAVVRSSVHYYNTEQEIEALVTALNELAA